MTLKPNEQEDLRADLTKPIKKKKVRGVWRRTETVPSSYGGVNGLEQEWFEVEEAGQYAEADLQCSNVTPV